MFYENLTIGKITQSKHKKKYKNKNREKIRKNTFLRRNRGIKQHNNQAGVLYKLEVNQFADWVRIKLGLVMIIYA